MKKNCSYLLVLILIFALIIRVKSVYQFRQSDSLLLSNVIVNEAWTLKNYHQPFKTSSYFNDKIYQGLKKDTYFLHKLYTIPKTETPNLVSQYNDEHGVSLLLALIWIIVGQESIIWLQIMQIFIDVLCIYLLYLIGKKFVNKSVGLLMALMYAAFFYQVLWLSQVHTYQWTSIFSILALYIASHFYQDTNPKIIKNLILSILLGIIIGLSIWVRSSSILLAISIFSLIIFGFSFNLRKKIFSFAIISLIIILILSPLLIHNYRTTGEIFILRGIKWHTLLASLGVINNSYGLKVSDGNIVEVINKRNPAITSYLGDYNTVTKPYEKEAKKLYLEIVKNEPTLIIKAFLYRFVNLYLLNNLHLYSTLFAKFQIIFHVIFLIFYSAIYLLFSYAKRNPILIALYFYAFSYYFAISCIYVIWPEYIFPIFPALFLIFSDSLYKVIHKLEKILVPKIKYLKFS